MWEVRAQIQNMSTNCNSKNWCCPLIDFLFLLFLVSLRNSMQNTVKKCAMSGYKGHKNNLIDHNHDDCSTFLEIIRIKVVLVFVE